MIILMKQAASPIKIVKASRAIGFLVKLKKIS
mgnify:FL=1